MPIICHRARGDASRQPIHRPPRGAGTRPFDQGNEVGVRAQRDGLQISTRQGQDHGSRCAVVGDHQWLGLNTGNIIREWLGCVADLDGLHNVNFLPEIRSSLWCLTPTALTRTTGSGESSTS